MLRTFALLATATVVFSAATASQAATTLDSCSTVAACVLGTNTYKGIGVNGASKLGFGVEGSTSVAATSPANARAGVLGKDLSTNKNAFNSGVSGTSTYGYGVYGSSARYDGVIGISPTHVGVCGNSETDQPPGRSAPCTSDGPIGVSGNATNGYGVIGYSYNVAGVYAISNNGTGAYISNLTDAQPALSVTGGQIGGSAIPKAGNPLIEAGYSNSSSSVFELDQVGNLRIGGTLTENTSSQVRTATTSGKYVASYGARAAEPTIEDFGTATLRGGFAKVALDKTFASAISPGYMVFVTPHGDSNGLYAEVSPSGFTVRENRNGRTTLAFDYRIVGKPLDAVAAHLPAMSPLAASRLPVRPQVRFKTP